MGTYSKVKCNQAPILNNPQLFIVMHKIILARLKFIVILFTVIVFWGCNSNGKYNLKTIVSSEGLKRITFFNYSCMSDGLWTGAVVMAGTLKNGITFQKSWGYLSIEKKVKMSRNAIFDLASLTKTVATATALSICMDRGLFYISAPFNQYLPEYRGTLMEKITVLDLVRHLSGFDNSKPYIEDGKVVENLLNHSPVRKVGKYKYACCNYIFLGLIVEKITNESLDQFCQTNIFTPLEMKDTRWSPLIKPDKQLVVKSIFTPELGIVSDEPARAAKRPIGNAGLFSTAEDLSKYCLMILNNGRYKGKSILSEKAIKLLTTKPDLKSPVSFGWRIDSKYNPSLFSDITLSHTGFTGGSIWIDIKKQKFIIILTNRTGDHDMSQDARIRFAEILLEEMKNN